MKPIVLVHGLFGHQKDPRILKSFGDRPVFAPDLLGYGEFREAAVDGLTLFDQARHVMRFVQNKALGEVHLVGHSVGGVVAALCAIEWSHRIASLTSVEGNFTIKDAFWSRSISDKSNEEVRRIFDGYRSDSVAWFAGMGVPSSPWSDQLSISWLDNQSAEAVRAQATAVVKATLQREYLPALERVFHSSLPVNLIAGERSSADWDTPMWANQCCATRINIPRVGHLMMAEDPEGYARAIIACVEHAQRCAR
ncbi:alpha/beta fold hydrolase [Mesorhizobium sp. PL10]